MEIKLGNVKNETTNNPQRRGWIIGSFIEDNSIFHSDEFEVKWAEHKKGYFKKGLKTDLSAKTMTILVTGSFKINFLDKFGGEEKSVILKELGDYVAYDASNVDHSAEAIEDCLVIVFRWPSKR